MYDKFHGSDHLELCRIFKKFGEFMALIHRVYKGAQHGDCSPSNVFYDHMSDGFTLIDMSDFGHGPYVTEWGHDDVESFVRGIRTLTQWYGAELISEAERHFLEGYGPRMKR